MLSATLAAAVNDAKALEQQQVQDQFTITQLTTDLAAAKARIAELEGTVTPPPPPPPPATTFKVGSYMGHGAGQIDDSAQWFKDQTGVYPKVVMTYSGDPSGWFVADADLTEGKKWLDADPSRLIVLSILPIGNDQQQGWDDAAWDSKHSNLATRLVSLGIASRVIIRLGWEMNATYVPTWGYQAKSKSAADMQAAQAGYKRMFRRIAPLYRAKGLRTNWCTNFWQTNNTYYPFDSRLWYPGADVVDIHGIDYYDIWLPGITSSSTPDQRWAATKAILDGAKAYATQQGKPFAVDEWGCFPLSGAPAYGGGDNPTFITESGKWQKANCMYSVYFESAGGGVGVDLTALPKARAAFAAVFA